MSKLTCETMREFLEACAYFVREGIVFRAFSGNLTIEFTGGY